MESGVFASLAALIACVAVSSQLRTSQCFSSVSARVCPLHCIVLREQEDSPRRLPVGREKRYVIRVRRYENAVLCAADMCHVVACKFACGVGLAQRRRVAWKMAREAGTQVGIKQEPSRGPLKERLD